MGQQQAVQACNVEQLNTYGTKWDSNKCASLRCWQVLDNPHTLLCTGADWPRQTHCTMEKHQLLLQSSSTGLLADEQALT